MGIIISTIKVAKKIKWDIYSKGLAGAQETWTTTVWSLNLCSTTCCRTETLFPKYLYFSSVLLHHKNACTWRGFSSFVHGSNIRHQSTFCMEGRGFWRRVDLGQGGRALRNKEAWAHSSRVKFYSFLSSPLSMVPDTEQMLHIYLWQNGFGQMWTKEG